MAWGDPQDYWWLRPKEEQNHLQALQLGAQLRQQAITNALRQKDLELENQRTGIQVQEYFSKKELHNREMEGVSSLAKSMSKIGDMSNPMIEEVILGELSKNSTPGMVKIAEQFLDNHRLALQFRQRQEELVELRLSREQMAASALAERVARREGVEATNAERTAILQQRADYGQMDAEGRAELREFRMVESTLTHEERDRQLTLQEMNTATRQQRLNNQIQNLPPEKRDLLKRDMDRLDVRAEANEFMQRMPWGTKNIKYGPKYDEERKKLLDSYGVSNLPLNTTLKNPITKDEYDKLPSGAEYVAPDGSTRVKK